MPFVAAGERSLPPNSFSRLDDSRPVNTPRSLLACDLEGILPQSLVAGANSPKRKASQQGIEQLKFKLEQEFAERERKKLIEIASQRWSQVSRMGSTGSSSGRSPRGRNDAGQGNASTSASNAEKQSSQLTSTTSLLFGLDKEIAADVLRTVSSDTSVAQHFLRLKASVEEAAVAKEKLAEREATARERYEAVKKQRIADAENRSARFQQQWEKVVTSKTQQMEERKAKHEARIEALQTRLETADKLVQEVRATKSTKAAGRGGEEERIAAEQTRKDRLAALETKLETANRAAEERKAARQQEEVLNQFKMDLKHQAMEEAHARAQRSQKFRQEQIRQREAEGRIEDQERDEEDKQRAKARFAAREMIAKQREDISKYVEQFKAEEAATVPPPPWLVPRLKQLEAEKSASPRMPRPPASNSQTVGSSSSTKKQKDSEGSVSSRSLPKLLAKDKFTINSPRISERQVFSDWMYE